MRTQISREFHNQSGKYAQGYIADRRARLGLGSTRQRSQLLRQIIEFANTALRENTAHLPFALLPFHHCCSRDAEALENKAAFGFRETAAARPMNSGSKSDHSCNCETIGVIGLVYADCLSCLLQTRQSMRSGGCGWQLVATVSRHKRRRVFETTLQRQ